MSIFVETRSLLTNLSNDQIDFKVNVEVKNKAQRKIYNEKVKTVSRMERIEIAATLITLQIESDNLAKHPTHDTDKEMRAMDEIDAEKLIHDLTHSSGEIDKVSENDKPTVPCPAPLETPKMLLDMPFDLGKPKSFSPAKIPSFPKGPSPSPTEYHFIRRKGGSNG